MRDVPIQNQESFPQEDIEKLAGEAERVRSLPQFKETEPKTIVKESLKAFGELPSKTLPPAKPVGEEDEFLPDYMQAESPEIKQEVESLLNLAANSGLTKAILEARRHQSFIVDAFHDALAEKLLPELQKRGVLK